MVSIGIDIGSTTVKIVILDEKENILYKCYERHLSFVRQKTIDLLEQAAGIIGDEKIKLTITGSAGQGVASLSGLPFAQEVFVTGEMVKRYYPDTDCVIELGGEDAKIIFLKGGLEERMNGSCAGGTGAFIDQMAVLMNMSGAELDRASLQAERIYTIASRCGVFAKSDIQPLLNQGAKKENIAASIFQAVVDQTITGLAQGRDIKGNILFLGGPLHFYMGLRKRFTETLKTSSAIFPDIAPYAVALGSALYSVHTKNEYSYTELMEMLRKCAETTGITVKTPPLFTDREEYEKFVKRHSAAAISHTEISAYEGGAYLGIDCGSTTTKIILIAENYDILYTYYASNQGNPVTIILEQLKKIYSLCGDKIKIISSAVTGYGEDLIKSAFSVDFGIVETMAHYYAAHHFCPNVNFILDIGGQDIKCFKIKNGAVDNIMLNEACSSGCGSFIETFASGMGYNAQDFAALGLLAKHPIDLGSRCTVFMNSSVKQAQKEGAGIGDISAGLSMSVVKNALYKVIRIHDPSELGDNIVVQGGTFLNDAILRAFEKELGKNVIRPCISGLMGAFGAAIFAKKQSTSESGLLHPAELENFTHTSKTSNCGLCSNKCAITVNTFSGGGRYVSGNKCQRPLGIRENENIPNMYQFKLQLLKDFISSKKPSAGRKTIGVPFGLNMYELLPFWYTLWYNLGYNVSVSDISDRELYRAGQHSIPSDTVCYPAKLMHGHMENLLAKGITDIFYPCMTYNIDEGISDNHYNCPVVAYYPELLKANMNGLAGINFMMPYFDISEPTLFNKKAVEFFLGINPNLTRSQVKAAVKDAYSAQKSFMDSIYKEGERAVKYASDNGLSLVVLCGRPYHIDPEINHGIDKLINSFGNVIISEEAASMLAQVPQKAKVLNQWTYHARLYNSARFAADTENARLVQLVSFGCGIDAITTDEIREILESSSKLYTQIKIDEINNLGAARIRIRSMMEAVASRLPKRTAR